MNHLMTHQTFSMGNISTLFSPFLCFFGFFLFSKVHVGTRFSGSYFLQKLEKNGIISQLCLTITSVCLIIQISLIIHLRFKPILLKIFFSKKTFLDCGVLFKSNAPISF